MVLQTPTAATLGTAHDYNLIHVEVGGIMVGSCFKAIMHFMGVPPTSRVLQINLKLTVRMPWLQSVYLPCVEHDVENWVCVIGMGP